MKVCVTLQHPAHVHFFRNVLEALENRGHQVAVRYRDEELVAHLLDAYDIGGTRLAGANEGRLGALRNQAVYEVRLLRDVLRFDPDVLTAVGGIAVAHVGAVTRTPSVVFADSGDHAPLNRFGTRVADVVCAPDTSSADYGANQRTYAGYHELAYLHPDRFEADPTVLRDSGVRPDDPYAVVRFVGWKAQHDVGERGFDEADKHRLIDALEPHGAVYVTTEGELPAAFEEYRLPVQPEAIHHLLAFANLYVGDSQTMATEAALLGTPAIRCNTFAGADDMGNFRELEDSYGLVRSTPDPDEAIQLAREWAADPDTDAAWAEKRAAIYADKIDVVDFVVDELEEAASGEQATGTRPR